MPTFEGKVSGRVRVIVDGDNINATEYPAGKLAVKFTKTLMVRDLEAPENAGAGSAQPTGSHSGQPGDGG